MKGTYRIIVETNKIKYDFEINRQINILVGNSATGKSVLYSYIKEYENNESANGVQVTCEVPCVTLEGKKWKQNLETIDNSIVFIDEDSVFVTSEDFAKAIKHSNNYYIIINRRKLSQLPYSINCIYAIRQSGKYMNTKQIYNEVYQLYSDSKPEFEGIIHV